MWKFHAIVLKSSRYTHHCCIRNCNAQCVQGCVWNLNRTVVLGTEIFITVMFERFIHSCRAWRLVEGAGDCCVVYRMDCGTTWRRPMSSCQLQCHLVAVNLQPRPPPAASRSTPSRRRRLIAQPFWCLLPTRHVDHLIHKVSHSHAGFPSVPLLVSCLVIPTCAVCRVSLWLHVLKVICNGFSQNWWKSSF